MYTAHSNLELLQHFRQRPYQGVDPSIAMFLFVGLDANYDPDLELSESFRAVLDYHRDGVSFWQKHGVHHPFLMSGYRGDGRRYHQTFARIGFTPEHADLVSFVELLHVPTVGRNKLQPADLDPSHLQRINSAILNGQAKYIFVSAGVVRLMRASKAFPWLQKQVTGNGPLGVLYRDESRTVYLHLHFSNYGKFQQQLEVEGDAIATLLPPTAPVLT